MAVARMSLQTLAVHRMGTQLAQRLAGPLHQIQQVAGFQRQVLRDALVGADRAA